MPRVDMDSAGWQSLLLSIYARRIRDRGCRRIKQREVRSWNVSSAFDLDVRGVRADPQTGVLHEEELTYG